MDKVLVSDLKRVRDLIEKTDLCKGTFARDKNGDEINYTSRNARSFCLHGAILRTARNGTAVEKFFDSRYGNFAVLNDQPETTKDQMLTFLDLSINEAETTE